MVWMERCAEFIESIERVGGATPEKAMKLS